MTNNTQKKDMLDYAHPFLIPFLIPFLSRWSIADIVLVQDSKISEGTFSLSHPKP